MTLRSSFLKKLSTSGTKTVSKRKPRARTRPRLEWLEERMVLSTLTVTNTLDDGSTGSLRWAVTQANTSAGDDTINL